MYKVMGAIRGFPEGQEMCRFPFKWMAKLWAWWIRLEATSSYYTIWVERAK